MREFDRKAFALRIAQLRLERTLSNKALAEKAGISEKFLAELEANKKGCSAAILSQLAQALNVSADYLLTGEEPVTKEDYKDIVLILESFTKEELPYIQDILIKISDFSKKR